MHLRPLFDTKLEGGLKHVAGWGGGADEKATRRSISHRNSFEDTASAAPNYCHLVLSTLPYRRLLANYKRRNNAKYI